MFESPGPMPSTFIHLISQPHMQRHTLHIQVGGLVWAAEGLPREEQVITPLWDFTFAAKTLVPANPD